MSENKIFKTVIRQDDIPDIVEDGFIYLIGEKCLWCIVFLCPCGCGDIVYLNALTDTNNPKWFVVFNDSEISVYPSVNRIVGCQSHFIIEKGNVKFV